MVNLVPSARALENLTLFSSIIILICVYINVKVAKTIAKIKRQENRRE
jgi:hypothetical protein